MQDPSESTAATASQLFVDYLTQRGGTGAMELDSLCSRHPHLASELRSLQREWEHLSPVLDALGPAATLSARLASRFGAGADPGVSLESADESEGAAGAGALLESLEARKGFGRYEPRSEVARGGQGMILKVWDRDLRRNLAMKLLLGRRGAELPPEVDSRSLGRFLEEAQITGQLDHPGIVPVHELGLDDKGRVYFTMKLVKGRDLRAIFELVHRAQEGWTLTRAVGVLQRVCEAVSYAHAKGVIHRDLKPGNVMVGRFGEVYVMDWGLARVCGRADRRDVRPKTEGSTVRTMRDGESPLVTMDGDVVGTPAYMAPEQAGGRVELVDERSDVYAIGAMLYHLLAGHMPYGQASSTPPPHRVLRAVLEGPPVALPPQTGPAELRAICARAMVREREERYANVLDLGEDLRAYLEQRVVRAYESGAAAELRKWVRRNRGVSAASLLLVLVAFTGLARTSYVEAAGRRRAEEEATRTNAARQEARARLAENYVRLADYHRERGEWAEVLTAVSGARAEGYPHQAELLLKEADAHLARYEHDRALSLLEVAGDAPDPWRGPISLRKGALLLALPERVEEGEVWLGRALAAELDPADREFAQALLAEGVEETLAHLRGALERDPLHCLAHWSLVTSLVLSGRLEEAQRRARDLALLFPRDPLPELVDVTVRVLRGEIPAPDLDVDRLAERLGAENAARFSEVIQVLASLRESVGIEDWIGAPKEKPSANPQLALWVSIEKAKDAEGLQLLLFLAPRMRSLQSTWSGVWTGLRSLFARRWSEAEAGFAEAVRLDPANGFYRFLLAGAMMNREAPTVQDMAAKMRAAMEEYLRAIDAPSIFPEIARAAAFWGFQAQLIIATAQPSLRDPALRPRAIEGFRRIPAFETLTAYELEYYVGLALDSLQDPDLADLLLDELVQRYPERDARGLRCRIALLERNWAAVVDLTSSLLDEDPANEAAKAWHDQAYASLDAWMTGQER